MREKFDKFEEIEVNFNIILFLKEIQTCKAHFFVEITNALAELRVAADPHSSHGTTTRHFMI